MSNVIVDELIISLREKIESIFPWRPRPLLFPCLKYSFNVSQNICHEWYVSNTSFFPQYQYLKKPPFSGSSRIWKPSVHRSSSQSPAHPPAAIKCHRTSKQKTKLAEKISKSELFHQIVRRVSHSLSYTADPSKLANLSSPRNLRVYLNGFILI